MFYKVGLKYLSVNFSERNKHKIYITRVKMVTIWEDGATIIGRYDPLQPATSTSDIPWKGRFRTH